MGVTVLRALSVTAVPYTFTNVFGEVTKVLWDYGNTTTTGSVYLLTSGLGAEEKISQVDGFSADLIRYPTLEPQNNMGVGIGSTTRFPYTVYGDLRVAASGTGLETAGSYFSIEVHVKK